jgi:hypothetical protein
MSRGDRRSGLGFLWLKVSNWSRLHRDTAASLYAKAELGGGSGKSRPINVSVRLSAQAL